jgi:hypothetical protein
MTGELAGSAPAAQAGSPIHTTVTFEADFGLKTQPEWIFTQNREINLDLPAGSLI